MLSSLVCVGLLLVVGAFAWAAPGGNLRVESQASSVKAGDIIVIDVSFTCDKYNLSRVSGLLEYDKSRFRYVENSATCPLGEAWVFNFRETDAGLSFGVMDNHYPGLREAHFLSLQFVCLEDVTRGQAEFKLTDCDWQMPDFQKPELEIKNLTIEVQGKAPSSSPTQTPALTPAPSVSINPAVPTSEGSSGASYNYYINGSSGSGNGAANGGIGQDPGNIAYLPGGSASPSATPSAMPLATQSANPADGGAPTALLYVAGALLAAGIIGVGIYLSMRYRQRKH